MGGLGRLSRRGLVDEEQIVEDAEDAYARIEQLKNDMQERLGVSEPPRPKNHPVPLDDMDIQSMGNRELGAYHAQFVAYVVFIGDRLAEIEVMERTAHAHLKKVKAKISMELRAEGHSEAKVKDLALLHPIYEEAFLEHEKLYNMKKIVSSYHSGYKEVAKALSRNVTIRELEFEQQKRDSNVQHSKGRKPDLGDSRPSGRGKSFGRRRARK